MFLDKVISQIDDCSGPGFFEKKIDEDFYSSVTFYSCNRKTLVRVFVQGNATGGNVIAIKGS